MAAQPKLIAVAVALPVHQLYTYSVPDTLADLADIGKRVLVPFGPRRITGYICGAGIADTQHAVRPILDILDQRPLFPESMLPFFQWAADYYLHPIGDVIQTALPGGLNVHDVVTLAITTAGQAALESSQARGVAHQVLTHLESEAQTVKTMAVKLRGPVSTALLQELLDNGWISRQQELRGGRTRRKLERHVTAAEDFKMTGRLSPSRRKILDVLAQHGRMPLTDLRKHVSGAPRLVTAMARSGQVLIEERPVDRDPLGEVIKGDTAHQLNDEQAQAVAAVSEGLAAGFGAFLLAGVTGSGKTEVYMQLARKVLDNGRSVLVLVPEIALISQMERRFRARFGECVAVLHSGLSAGERYDQWLRIFRGDVSIAIGARSAIFAPFADIGLVIVDEEHDASYKQDGGLRYNARDLAVVRGRGHACPVVLGSATPSVQAWYNVSVGKFTGLELTGRVAARPMPEITIVDLREARHERGIQRYFTPALKEAMAAALDRREQVLLFLNRRGFASYPVCGECGEAVKCRHCDISLTLHQAANAYRCHYCGFSMAATTDCQACGSSRIIMLGVGTERVETAVTALFPEAVVARMDRDTTSRKGAVVRLLKKLHQGQIDILIGTQMVAKGHDFPNITVVGILCADLSLSFPDFRSGARTFQLLAQVAGRAGRGEKPGNVILQTYNPDHFSITAACRQDFRSFYAREIEFRKELHYPPFARFIQLRISGKKQAKVRDRAQVLGGQCRRLIARDPTYTRSVEVLGPIEAPMTRIAGQYRWQLLLKSGSVAALHGLVQTLQSENPKLFSQPAVRVAVDVDPISMM